MDKSFKNPDNKYSPFGFLFANDKFEAVHMKEMQKEFETKDFSIGYI